MTPWWKACDLLPVHLMLSCTCHHPLCLWGLHFVGWVTLILLSCSWTSACCAAAVCGGRESAFPWTSPHSCHPRPWPQTFPLFQRFMAWELGCASPGKRFQRTSTSPYKWLSHKSLENGSIGKRKSCRKGYSNRWRQEEEQQKQCWYGGKVHTCDQGSEYILPQRMETCLSQWKMLT